MAITAKEAIEGIALDYVLNGLISDKPDAITILSESRQVETDKRTHTQIVGKDGNIVSSVDAYGNVTSDADLAELADRTHGTYSWEFPKEQRIVLRISHEDMARYGISNTMLNKELKTEADYTAFNKLTAPLNAEFKKLLMKVRKVRRSQVRELLVNLQAPVNDWQKAMGYAIVDDAINRPNYFNYTNKLGSSTLDETEFALAVDLLASDQVNIMNDDFEIDMATVVLHAKRLSVAEAVFAPKLAVDANKGRAGASLDGGANQAVGVYGDTDNAEDWIVLGMYHTIRRMNWKGLNGKNGIKVEIHPSSNRTYGVELVAFLHSIMVVDSPISIVKNVTPVA